MKTEHFARKMNDIKATWVSTKAAGMWFVLLENGDLYEAWAWEGQNVPPETFNQEGYRFSRP